MAKYYNVRMLSTGDMMLGQSPDTRAEAQAHCDRYNAKYGGGRTAFVVMPVDFRFPDWFPQELRDPS